MEEVHYLISDASRQVQVETHVLRYWEEELGLLIPRNELGHRYYTEVHIRLFRQIKKLKEQGYQLKAIRGILGKMEENQKTEPEGLLEAQAQAVFRETGTGERSMSRQENMEMGKNTGAENKIEPLRRRTAAEREALAVENARRRGDAEKNESQHMASVETISIADAAEKTKEIHLPNGTEESKAVGMAEASERVKAGNNAPANIEKGADGKAGRDLETGTDGTEQEILQGREQAADSSALSTPNEKKKLTQAEITQLLAGEKMRQFQQIMNQVIGRAIEENSEKLSQDVSYLVHDKLMKEMEYLMRVSDEREEERFKRLDEIIRAYQRENQGRAEAAATAQGRFPFFRTRMKKKKFGRNGNKL